MNIKTKAKLEDYKNKLVEAYRDFLSNLHSILESDSEITSTPDAIDFLENFEFEIEKISDRVQFYIEKLGYQKQTDFKDIINEIFDLIAQGYRLSITYKNKIRVFFKDSSELE